MGEDFRPVPVPIRLSCRYSNGTVVSCVARALAYDDSFLRVLSSEGFDKGIQLSVVAPFLDGIVTCRVSATSRSRDEAAYFELKLRFLKKPTPPTRLEVGSAAGEMRLSVPEEEKRPPVPEAVGLVARELAGRLEQGGALRYSQLLEMHLPAQRPNLLAISAAAVAMLLQEKSLLDVRHLVATFQRKSRA